MSLSSYFLTATLLVGSLLLLGSCKGSKKAQSSTSTASSSKPAATAPATASTPAKSQAEIDEALILQYLQTNKIKKFERTPSGVYYVIDEAGSKEKPTLKSNVKCHYRGTLLDGTEFDSSYKRNQPLDFPLTNVIKGWQDGIPTIGKGGKVKLLIPSDLAYGARNMGTIKPHSVLLFDVELLDFK